MAMSASVHLECDLCGAEEDHDLEAGESPEDIVDREGWQLTGILLDRLACPQCDEDEDA